MSRSSKKIPAALATLALATSACGISSATSKTSATVPSVPVASSKALTVLINPASNKVGPELAQLRSILPKVAKPNMSLVVYLETDADSDDGFSNQPLLVSKSPSGSQSPNLVALPKDPPNATQFQSVQYKKALAKANKINSSLLASSNKSKDQKVKAWANAQVATLGADSSNLAGIEQKNNEPWSIVSGLNRSVGAFNTNSSQGVVLVLGGADSAPSTGLNANFGNSTVVIANVSSIPQRVIWTNALKAAGANGQVMGVAKTQLNLAQVINQNL